MSSAVSHSLPGASTNFQPCRQRSAGGGPVKFDTSFLVYRDWKQMSQYNGTDVFPSNFSNSTFYTAYTCPVPRLKSRFNIFVSILVADLVLLRVAWTLLNFAVTYFLKDRHQDANSCLGCAERHRDVAGSRGDEVVDTGEDTVYHGRDIEMGDLGGDLETQSDQQSLQKLLNREAVGS